VAEKDSGGFKPLPSVGIPITNSYMQVWNIPNAAVPNVYCQVTKCLCDRGQSKCAPRYPTIAAQQTPQRSQSLSHTEARFHYLLDPWQYSHRLLQRESYLRVLVGIWEGIQGHRGDRKVSNNQLNQAFPSQLYQSKHVDIVQLHILLPGNTVI
jgi:hypothetical protein